MHDQDDIIRMIQQGGVYYNISGDTPDTVFADAVAQFSLPSGVDSQQLYTGLCEREKLMTTSMGYGIALPHPRASLISSDKDERIYVCFLDKPVDFDAMDGKPVDVLFVILSAGSQRHLYILSRLSWFLQKEDFRAGLKKKPDTQELISVIKYYS